MRCAWVAGEVRRMCMFAIIPSAVVDDAVE